LYDENGISVSITHDSKKETVKMLKFYSDSDLPNLTVATKTLHQAKNISVDKVLLTEWKRRRRCESYLLLAPTAWPGQKYFVSSYVPQHLVNIHQVGMGKIEQRHGLRFLAKCGEKNRRQMAVVLN
jgi:hypothetical protein